MTRVVEWPNSLVQELADRRAILVLGSGLSAQSKSIGGLTPPTWREFIAQTSRGCALNGATSVSVEQAIEAGQLPTAAQIIRDRANPQEFASVVRSTLQGPRFSASFAHNAIAAIDSPIVINLNFDRIYENLCQSLDPESYVVSHYYNQDFVRNIRSPQRVILKIHGSLDDPTRMVFSGSDYIRAQQENREVFETVGALLRTRTVLFIGCGFQGDPDVDRLLTETALNSPNGYPHFALIGDDSHADAFNAATERGLRVDYIRYGIDSGAEAPSPHINFATALDELRGLVLEARQLSV